MPFVGWQTLVERCQGHLFEDQLELTKSRPVDWQKAEGALRRRDGFWFSLLTAVSSIIAGIGLGIYFGVTRGDYGSDDVGDNAAILAIILCPITLAFGIALDLHVKDQFLIRSVHEDFINNTELYRQSLHPREIDRIEERSDRSNRSQLLAALAGIMIGPLLGIVLLVAGLATAVIAAASLSSQFVSTSTAVSAWNRKIQTAWHMLYTDMEY